MYIPFVSLNIKNSTQERVDSILAYNNSLLSYKPKIPITFQVATSLSWSQVGRFLFKYLQKKPTFYLLIFSSLLIALPTEGAFAAPEDLCVPEKQTFIATAYYSPLPNQNAYSQGSYEAEIALNGRGISGASGMPVFAGMIAAPKSYAFGTKILLENLGIFTVHDRGGAIVATCDDLSHDRIDIWMGQGDEGRIRAKNWGVRKVSGTILPAGDTGDTPPVDLNAVVRNAPNEKVNLQEVARKKLQLLGYNVTDTPFKDVIKQFQLEYKVIASPYDSGAGHCGPRTRETLNKAYENIRNTQVPSSEVAQAPEDDSLEDLIARHDTHKTTASTN